MAPYRTPSGPTIGNDARANERDEDRSLGWLLLLIGAVRIAVAIVGGEVFRAEATVALLMVAVGVGMLNRAPDARKQPPG